MIPLFRAWSKRYNIMINLIREIDFSHTTIKGMAVYNFVGEPHFIAPHYQHEMADFDDIVLMQGSSVGDTDGKELFEGDVVFDDFEKRYGVIKIDTGAFIVAFKDENPTLRDYGTDSLKIIGNIYENPELLEKVNMKKFVIKDLINNKYVQEENNNYYLGTLNDATIYENEATAWIKKNEAEDYFHADSFVSTEPPYYCGFDFELEVVEYEQEEEKEEEEKEND